MMSQIQINAQIGISFYVIFRLHEEAKSPKVLSYLNEHSQIKLDIRRKYLRD